MKAVIAFICIIMFSFNCFAGDEVVSDTPVMEVLTEEEELPPLANYENMERLGPGIYIPAAPEFWQRSPEDLSEVYLSIPLTADDVELLGRMAYGETMYHDGTCPANTVKACYEVVFNRYLHDANATDGSLFHRGELTISRLLTKGQFEGIVSQSRWNNLSDEKKAEYRNLVWQVHNQGPTVLNTNYLYWQSSAGSRHKEDRLWVGFIYDDAGNKVEGVTTDRSKIVKGHGNWYRKDF